MGLICNQTFIAEYYQNQPLYNQYKRFDGFKEKFLKKIKIRLLNNKNFEL